jgi:DNA-binding transcriptional MerR regulator
MGRMKNGLKIGELAERCGVSRDTIRFYEREGLLPRPQRTPALYRVYGDEDEGRLLFIRQAQALGLTSSRRASSGVRGSMASLARWS